MELMNIEKKSPSILHGAMVSAAYIWPKKHLCLSTPPLLFFKKFEVSSCGARGWVWMANSYVDGKFSSLPSRIYYGCMVNLPCSMDL
jgi:hypothetical protein